MITWMGMGGWQYAYKYLQCWGYSITPLGESQDERNWHWPEQRNGKFSVSTSVVPWLCYEFPGLCLQRRTHLFRLMPGVEQMYNTDVLSWWYTWKAMWESMLDTPGPGHPTRVYILFLETWLLISLNKGVWAVSSVPASLSAAQVQAHFQRSPVTAILIFVSFSKTL